MKLRKKPVLLAAATLLLLVTAASVLLFCKPSLRYRLGETVAAWFADPLLNPADEDTLRLVPYTMTALLASEKVTFNQSMLLINSAHPIADGLVAETVEYGTSGVIMNACVTEAYRALAADVAEVYDEKLFIMSAYRTAEEQAEAIAAEGDKAAGVNESEHRVGLALDVYVRYYAGMGFLDSPVGQYVNKTCHRYGFIIRYPAYGTDSTGMGFEPWHLRYVGYPHAEIMARSRMTLEEYFDALGTGAFFRYGEHFISVQAPSASGGENGENELLLPESFISAVISSDNRGNYVVTVET